MIEISAHLKLIRSSGVMESSVECWSGAFKRRVNDGRH